MKLELDKKGQEVLDEVLSRHEDSLFACEFYNAFLRKHYAALSPDDIEDLSRELKIPLTEAYFFCLLFELGTSYEELSSALHNNDLRKVQQLDPGLYSKDPYLKNVHPDKYEKDGYKLEVNRFVPYEGFLYKDVSAKREDLYSEIYSLGFFKKTFRYLQLAKDGKVWMTITPYEIETMRDSLAKAKGKVLTFGLGLGYFPFHCLLKDDVEDVTVVEKEEAVIDLFTKKLLPFFPNKEKLKIVKADAYDFLADRKLEKYDYLFIDTYHNEEDGIPFYLNMMGQIPSSLQYSFWDEGTMLTICRRVLMELLKEEKEGTDEENYKDPQTRDDKLYSGFHELTKDIVLKTGEDILDLLSDENVRSLAKNFKIRL